MANETVRVEGTPVTLVASGLALANGALSAAADSVYSIATQGVGKPFVKFVLSGTFGAPPTVNKILALLLRPMNIDGTLDAPVPTTTYTQEYVGNFQCSADTTQSLELIIDDLNLPSEFEAYVFNVDTGQSLTAGWTLKATPFTYAPAA